ncbi:MAG: hypothetical protein Q4C71_03485 [Microbacteriaceae bacterium]|nr:hypothetical protein [Microbacteriaceae bacterium]
MSIENGPKISPEIGAENTSKSSSVTVHGVAAEIQEIAPKPAENIATGQAPRKKICWFGWLFCAVPLLLLAYTEYAAIGNLTGVPAQIAKQGAHLQFAGWVLLVGGVVLPPVAAALALWFARHRKRMRVLLLFTALAVTVMWQNQFSWFFRLFPNFFLGS